MSKHIGAQMLEFQQSGDERGHLVIVEGMDDIPFDIARIFYIYGSGNDVVRGQHANRKTQFVLINVAGSCKVNVKDGKGNEAVFVLNIQEFIYQPCFGRICTILARILYYYAWRANITMRQSISGTMRNMSRL